MYYNNTLSNAYKYMLTLYLIVINAYLCIYKRYFEVTKNIFLSDLNFVRLYGEL